MAFEQTSWQVIEQTSWQGIGKGRLPARIHSQIMIASALAVQQ